MLNWPNVNFSHLRRLSDDTGLMEHALGMIPRRKEGYSTDDQARGIWACLEWLDLAAEEENLLLYDLLDTLLSFLLGVQQEDGHFHNNIAFDRTPEDETPSDDCLGRCLWALALAVVKLPEGGRRLAVEQMLGKALDRASDMTSPRGWAYALAAASLLEMHPNPFRPNLRPHIQRWSQRMIDMFRYHAKPGWRWYEPTLTYSNGLLPWGLMCAYEVLQHEELLDTALTSLNFLISMSSCEHGRIRPIGNNGWCTPRARAQWDQQPIDVFKLLLACAKAYELTGDAWYADTIERCRAWYYGENDADEPMVDEAEGACFDGIGLDGLNRNQGAEATLSYLLMEAVYRRWASLARHAPSASRHSSALMA